MIRTIRHLLVFPLFLGLLISGQETRAEDYVSHDQTYQTANFAELPMYLLGQKLAEASKRTPDLFSLVLARLLAYSSEYLYENALPVIKPMIGSMVEFIVPRDAGTLLMYLEEGLLIFNAINNPGDSTVKPRLMMLLIFAHHAWQDFPDPQLIEANQNISLPLFPRELKSEAIANPDFRGDDDGTPSQTTAGIPLFVMVNAELGDFIKPLLDENGLVLGAVHYEYLAWFFRQLRNLTYLTAVYIINDELAKPLKRIFNEALSNAFQSFHEDIHGAGTFECAICHEDHSLRYIASSLAPCGRHRFCSFAWKIWVRTIKLERCPLCRETASYW